MVIDEREEVAPPGDALKRKLRTTGDKVKAVAVSTGKIDTYHEQAEVAMKPRQEQ